MVAITNTPVTGLWTGVQMSSRKSGKFPMVNIEEISKKEAETLVGIATGQGGDMGNRPALPVPPPSTGPHNRRSQSGKKLNL